MYSKKSLHELRDTLLEKQEEIGFLPKGRTALYITKTLTLYSNPEELERYLYKGLEQFLGLPGGSEDSVDYALAYDLLFGDISQAPLHINDGLKIIAEWRFKNEDSLLCTPKKT